MNGKTTHQERLLRVLRAFPERKIVVIGDTVADQFVYGVISRVSREAPVFILRHEQTETTPGGAGNCAMNIAALGARVSLVSVVGNDDPGKALLSRLKAAKINCEGVVLSDDISTVTKLRVLAGQLHSPRQQVIRIDYEGKPLADSGLLSTLTTQVRTNIGNSDAVIISDYNYGVAGEEVSSAIREASAKDSKPVFVDSRFRLSSFLGFTSATPNEEEVDQLLGGMANDSSKIAVAGETLRQKLGFRALLVTRGSQGMVLLEEGAPAVNIKAVGGSEAVDVTGAGDTVIATYALGVASGASFADAARLANYAGGLVVMKRGTASVSAQELEESIIHSQLT